jgi:uncharacterized membrane protein YccC
VSNAATGPASPLRATMTGLRCEFADIALNSPRGWHSARAALAVALAVIPALALRLDAPWWAAISAFVSLQATSPASVRRGGLRIAGTAVGAALALLISPWLIEDHVAVSLVLFAASAIGVLGLQVSRHGYAWLLGGVTVDMVLLSALGAPGSTLEIACNRTVEVTIGTITAILVSLVLSPDAAQAPAQAQPAPGWSDLLGAQWPSTQHATRAGFGVVLVPWVWNWLELPSLSQTAITVAAVMAVQAVSDDDAANRKSILIRAVHRLLGCLIGGLAGLALLSLSLESFVPWLAALCVGVFIGASVQSGAHGVGYVGTQGAVVFMITLVQGWGPPADIIVGVERFAGITGGMAIVVALSALAAPSIQQEAAVDGDHAAGHVAGGA